ncbi:MFS transporter [Cumulibacter manganitolerans]|uniref:MFS transporter n=1 Tax=Cumulibacter manganitolerans TaxID=1884992 RepID=UPI001E2BE911|nr:MFS transporter [Cumulibacter manganitolerans]
MTDAGIPEPVVKKSTIPARMDRLPWTRFHWLVVVGLGVSWILDGLEIQIVSLNSGPLTDAHGTMQLTAGEIGALGSIYLLGEVVGALYFGRRTDKVGRKKLFILTLAIYLIGSGLGGFSWDFWSLAICRFVAGLGIGGEYTAINSAIDELIPARFRGRVDIAVNGTYWAGAIIGNVMGLFIYDTELVPLDWGWRIGFFIGPVLGLVIIFLRRVIPESPRWLLMHGRAEEAERTTEEIEKRVEAEGGALTPVPDSKAILLKETPPMTFGQMTRIFFKRYPHRSILGFTMMVTQAFLYNAIFFTYALVLKAFYGIPSDQIPWYFFPFAIGNLLGPLLLGHLFDTWGRRRMILLTYGGSGVLLLITAFLFKAGALSAVTQTVLWCIIFFFASAGASSAYLTVSEIFPLELRGQAISYFFAISQGAGGVLAPFIFGKLIGDPEALQKLGHAPPNGPLTWGYIIGAGLMIVGGLVAWFIGVDAEQKSLEDVAEPMSAVKVGGDGGGITPDLPDPEPTGRGAGS